MLNRTVCIDLIIGFTIGKIECFASHLACSVGRLSAFDMLNTTSDFGVCIGLLPPNRLDVLFCLDSASTRDFSITLLLIIRKHVCESETKNRILRCVKLSYTVSYGLRIHF